MASGVRRVAALALAASLTAGCGLVTDNGSSARGDSIPPRATTTAPETTGRPSAPPATAEDDVRPGLARYYDQSPDWSSCGGGFECAEVAVPLDYDDPSADQISIAVTRLPAEDGDDRIGSLLVNPGGPGGSGIDYVRRAPDVLGSAVRDRFDVVGFDPRGVGRSEPVECLDDEQLDEFVAADGSPDTPAEERAVLQHARELAEGCERRSGRLLPHVGTADAARDMDVLRAVLGDERLHYLGKSYGTFLGATYAGLFPSRVGRLVLDGALDPRVRSEDFNREQAEGFEVALDAFVRDCLEQDDCPLRGTPDEGLAQVDRFLADVDATPLRGDGERELPQGLAVLGIVAALYDETRGWPILRQALTQAFAGDGSLLLLLADLYTDRDPSGRYTTNQNEVIYAVNCVDRPEAGGDIASARRLAEQYERTAPHFGAYLAWSGLACASWPVRPQGKPGPIPAKGAAPILVVGTTRDPATPYEWAVGLAEQLESGVLLTWDGDGHTAYQSGSDCVDDVVDDYLIDGKVPAEGTRCR